MTLHLKVEVTALSHYEHAEDKFIEEVMVATVRCEEIASEKLSDLRSDKGWLELEEVVQLGPVKGFGEKLSSIIDTYLSLYDEETIFFDESVRNAKRKQLESNTLDIVFPVYATMIGHLRSIALKDFKTKLDGSLNNGKGFASSVQTWIQSIMLKFDKDSAGNNQIHSSSSS
ncbi:ROOT HAIR defective 3 GTP-binding family protein [Trifolium medium]|uniref:ROOT HAIR defective 3 GTP-binding family protein n=1 Tax=Trifolium medium TaxID=97028 RepID=A0A392M3Q2_9FABA|nr:ROOT HAIR defective 3 GTP-binding family protein [Trifolium medium]